MNHKKMKSFYGLVAILFCSLFLFPAEKAYAYLDPGSGSLIVQMIIAALIAIPLAFKGGWQKIAGFFRKKTKDDDHKKDPEQSA